MSRIGIVLWVGMNTLLFLGLHFYLWRRLVHGTRLVGLVGKGATALLAFFALSLPLAFAIRFFGPNPAHPAVWPAYVWMSFGLYLVLSLLGIDLARGVRRLGVRLRRRFGGGAVEAPAIDLERRQWLSRIVAGSAVATSGGLSALAIDSAIGGPMLEHVRVALQKLHPSLRGTRIAQISDLHIGQLIGKDYVEALVAQVNALSPDLVVITGDLVDGSPERLAEGVAPLAELRSRHGTFFVTGNHEYYAGVDDWMTHLPKLGIRVLHNERVSVGNSEASFDLAGVTDVSGHRYSEAHRADYERTLGGRDRSRPVVLLAHHPKAVFAAAEHEVDLQLSGHTHGGQLWPFTWFAHLIFPYVRGLATHGPTQIYVNRGTGWVGPPARLGSPSELTLIELV